MRNRLAWVAGALGAAGVAYRAVRKQPAPDAAGTAADPRADELRRKLDESKPLAEEREEFEAGETPVDASDSLEDKRAAVHERGRAAADEMRGPTASE
jgi:hypothetical protein